MLEALAGLPAPIAETSVAAVETSTNEPAAPEPASIPVVTPEAALAATKIAPLGGPAVTIEKPPVTAKAEPGKADRLSVATRSAAHVNALTIRPAFAGPA